MTARDSAFRRLAASRSSFSLLNTFPTRSSLEKFPYKSFHTGIWRLREPRTPWLSKPRDRGKPRVDARFPHSRRDRFFVEPVSGSCSIPTAFD